ncbi:hypothetical protein HJ167_18335 [Vibrio parahaemolyticus]|nr:hypothetical protein [Vibrio parahaemolyticus]
MNIDLNLDSENIGGIATAINNVRAMFGREKSETLLERCSVLKKNIINCINRNNDDVYYYLLFNLASTYVDIASIDGDEYITDLGLDIFNEYEKIFMELIPKQDFYNNIANALANKLPNNTPSQEGFYSVEKLVEVKNYQWKAIKAAKSDYVEPSLELEVNLANTLKRQFRVTESLNLYNKVNDISQDIPECWYNRALTLEYLSQMSGTYSIRLIEEIIHCYSKAESLESNQLGIKKYSRSRIDDLSKKLNELYLDTDKDEDDKEITESEFESFSEYRKFCVTNNLTLSEHGLYCNCSVVERDELVIPTNKGLYGDFVIPMELVLNRLKSEFSLARRMYFEYITDHDAQGVDYETCYSNLHNDEVVSINVEKLRTTFKHCFSILDKIAVATCELYDIYPKNNKVYFPSFWQLDQNNRREKFESIKNPGLLALYSIATDLNERKDGQWSFYKIIRNYLEHLFLVVHKEDIPIDMYDSYKFKEKIHFVKESDFVEHCELLMQFTRSAIFSFVFMVRHKSTSENAENTVGIPRVITTLDFRESADI